MSPEPLPGANFAVELSRDRTYVILAVNIGDSTVAHISLAAPDLEEVIEKFAMLRARMAEQVAPKIDPGARLQTISNPFWQVGAPSSPKIRNVILSIRHPGIGWIANQFSINQAYELSKSLSNLAQRQASY